MIRLWLPPARFGLCLVVSGWLAVMQPGMSHYWLIDPVVHTQIDAELYGQHTDGETLPGHDHSPPHEHPANQGIGVASATFTNPFNAGFYNTLLSPARRRAMFEQRVELAVIARFLAIEPPDQPPRFVV